MMKSAAVNFALDTPPDRAGTFEPQRIKKYQTHLSDEIKRRISALFALGQSDQDNRQQIDDLYGIEVPNGSLTAVTDKRYLSYKPGARDLDRLYPIRWLDAIHCQQQLQSDPA